MLERQPRDQHPLRLEERRRQHAERGRSPLCGLFERFVQILPGLDLQDVQRHLQPWRCCLHLLQDAGTRGRIIEDCHACDGRERLPKELKAFRAEFRFEGGHAGDVSARPGEACNESRSQRIGRLHHNGNSSRRSLGRPCSDDTARDDHVHRQPHEVGREFRETFEPALRPAVLDEDVLSLGVAQVAQALPEGIRRWVDGRAYAQDTDSRDLRGLLRFGGDRRDEESKREDQSQAAQAHLQADVRGR